jgi:signal transduction histidine kinase
MLMPASSEFVALCQSQVALLTQGLGAALSIVYITEELTEATDAKLVPVVAYPEAAAGWGEDQIFALLSRGRGREFSHRPLLPAQSGAKGSQAALPALPDYAEELESDVHPLQAAERALLRQQQVVLPLMHGEVVMGLLVTARADRAWTEAEQVQIEQIAETLAIACLLDQRSQWLAQDLHQQRLLREQKHDLFDNLLHQFRNPLTALRTFGKLLAKRLKPEDNNRSVAEGIVRESDRLQDLLQQFDAAIDLDKENLPSLPEATPVVEPEQLELDTAPKLADASSSPAHTAAPLLLPGAGLFVDTAIQLEPHAITEILEPLLDSAVAIAQDRQLTLQINLPANLPPVRVDVRALREVLSNLLDNALKYTPARGQICVSAQSQLSAERKNQQAIAIVDTGPGIPPQDLEHLFERRYRGVQAATNIPGTGLGLAIARDLVQQMQGEIQVFSPAQSSGILNRLLLPATQTTPSAQDSLPGTAIIVWLPEHSAE